MEDPNKIAYEEFLRWKETHEEILEPIPTQPLPAQPLPVQPQAAPVQPLPVSNYEYQAPQKIPKKKGRFKKWFFKGRIEKREAKEERIETLSREYNEGKIIKIAVVGE